MSPDRPARTTQDGWPATLVLAGAGRMGGALLRGWLAQGLPPASVRVLDPRLDPAIASFCAERGIGLGAPTAAPDVLVLAVKPQTFAAASDSFAALARANTLVVSILAGRTLAGLRQSLPGAGAIVRAMPNLPAAVGRGASALAGEAALSPARRAMAHRLLAAVGHAEWLDEALIDAVTAVSGSGPAYVFLLTEHLAAAGAAAGLPPDTADRLARATVAGAAALLDHEPDRTPAQLRAAVTSRVGTTAAALDVLGAADGLQPLLTRAVAAAVRRAGKLAE